jgi:hypothetical protein
MEFGQGCRMLLAAARGDKQMFDRLCTGRLEVNFRDYDRRTSLHVAASEGHLAMVKHLISIGAKVNRSDRWGGSPLDDALRHRHKEVAALIRKEGGRTGDADKTTSFITAAADGDLDEIQLLLEDEPGIINTGDYDKRTAMHLAAGEGNESVIRLLVSKKGVDVNVEDRFGGRPLDDAKRNKHIACVQVLLEAGARYGPSSSSQLMQANPSSIDGSGHELDTSLTGVKNIAESLKVDWKDLEMIDRIGAGEFGEIFKCKVRSEVQLLATRSLWPSSEAQTLGWRGARRATRRSPWRGARRNHWRRGAALANPSNLLFPPAAVAWVAGRRQVRQVGQDQERVDEGRRQGHRGRV